MPWQGCCVVPENKSSEFHINSSATETTLRFHCRNVVVMYSVTQGRRRVDPLAVRFIRQNQAGNGQRATTGISEAGQRRKQYQAEVGVTGTGSKIQGQAVRGETQR